MDREQEVPEASVQMPDRDEFLAMMRRASPSSPYDFGFAPAMARLTFALDRMLQIV